MTDSPLSARSTPFHFNFADFNSVPLRSNGRKLPRQSENIVRARSSKTPKAARLRPASKAIARDAPPGQDAALRREAPPVAEDKALARETSSGQDSGINRETGQLSLRFANLTLRRLRSRALHYAKLAGLTGKTKLV
jgi:hypothetical protein